MTNLLYGLAFSIFRALSEQVSDEERRQLEMKLAEMKEFASLSLGGWQRKLQDYCAHGCGMLANRQNHDAARLIVRTKTYIEEHIEQSLTVNDCARSVHLSPSYFANLFKKGDGHDAHAVRHPAAHGKSQSDAGRRASGAGDRRLSRIRGPTLFQRAVQEAYGADADGIPEQKSDFLLPAQ
ncbi:AraC family transcriptional regulator [Cohnella ginsengisoli]|uniref:AraC family transcriptional regulator n=1 Tax=Cohnella ginsengisoli TaxID=425004 RepID=A0A9X4KFV1_9BACL|nr:AraC family transcriptional regulator [Cohnella ginsengisoli]MDG0791216.1 AraC family transcriptional regulator [Cohnella ginsengisoli]